MIVLRSNSGNRADIILENRKPYRYVFGDEIDTYALMVEPLPPTEQHPLHFCNVSDARAWVLGLGRRP